MTGLKLQSTGNDNILMTLEYLANRLTQRHAVYFPLPKTASLVIGDGIPSKMYFETDILADAIKAVVEKYLQPAKEEYEKLQKPKDHIYLNLVQLQQLIK